MRTVPVSFAGLVNISDPNVIITGRLNISSVYIHKQLLVGSEYHPVSHPVGTFPGGKASETDQSPPTSAKVRNGDVPQLLYTSSYHSRVKLPQGLVRLEVLGKLKNVFTSSRLEPAAFRFGA
jgi:hypothetical protein